MSVPRAQYSTWTVDDYQIVVRHRVESNDEDPEIDPSFFDDDFNLAVATGGLRVWDGAKCLFDFMVEHADTYLNDGVRQLELGSGSGMLAMALAAKGANIVATDVKCGVDDIIRPSILLNSTAQFDNFWCKTAYNPSAIKLGKGSIACSGLDWRKPLPDFLQSIPVDQQPHYIVASEVVWLRELADPFLSCMKSCLATFGFAEGIMSFPIRGLDELEDENTQTRLVEVYCGEGYFLSKAVEYGLELTLLRTVAPNAKQEKEGVFGTRIFKITLKK